MRKIINQEVADEIADLHRGVHAALDALVTPGDLDRAELVLRQLDQRFVALRNEAAVRNLSGDSNEP